MSENNSISTHTTTVAPIAAADVLPIQEPLGDELYKESLQRLPIQGKLSIGAPDDPLEYEADAMADQVMCMPESNFIQRKCARCEEDEQVQRKPLSPIITPFIQTKGSDEGIANDSVSQQINSTKGSGNNLDRPVRSFMETRFGTDFSDVKIHTGEYAVQMSKELNAQAFTVGNDIYFNSGKYNPGSDSGKQLLAHELTHTLQQGASDKTIQRQVFGYSLIFNSQPKCPPMAEVQASNVTDSEIASELYGNPTVPIDHIDEYMINVDYNMLLDDWKPYFDNCVPADQKIISSEPQNITPAENYIVADQTYDLESSGNVSATPEIGIVAWDKTPRLNLREGPSTGSKALGQLDYNTRFQIIDQPSPTWYHISTENGRIGYVAKQYVKTNLPEPGAILHRVESGTSGTAIAIAEQYFHEEAGKWGMDLRFYINTIAYINHIKIPDAYDGWKQVHFKSGQFIWIPGKEFAKSLKGIVNSGSISYNVADAIGVAEYIEGLVQKLEDFNNAIRISKKYLWESIKKHFEEAVINALVALAEMIVISIAVLAVSSAIGAAVGAIFGGAGAAPGAAIGFEIGMTLLEWMGLVFLAKWIVDSVVKIGGIFVDFLSIVWNADGNMKKLEEGGYLFAEAIATLLGTLVEALVMFVAAEGLGFVVGKLKGTKLGEKLSETKLAEWLKDRMEKKATSKAKEEEPVKETTAEPATVAKGESVDGNRKLEVDSEGVCKVCASPCLKIIEKYQAEIAKLSEAYGRDMEAELLKIEKNKSISETQKLQMYEYLEQELANAKNSGLSGAEMAGKTKAIFDELAKFRSELTLPPARLEGGNPTIAKIEIAGTYEYGVNYNKSTTPSRPKAEIEHMHEVVKQEYNTNVTDAVIEHAEADAIISAFNNNLKADTASLYVDRPLCNFCKSSLKNLLPLLELKTLTVFEFHVEAGNVTSFTIFSPRVTAPPLPVMQPKLFGEASYNYFEKEADCIADHVMQRPEISFIQHKCAYCEEE